jgi:hypothetical protein
MVVFRENHLPLDQQPRRPAFRTGQFAGGGDQLTQDRRNLQARVDLLRGLGKALQLPAVAPHLGRQLLDAAFRRALTEGELDAGPQLRIPDRLGQPGARPGSPSPPPLRLIRRVREANHGHPEDPLDFPSRFPAAHSASQLHVHQHHIRPVLPGTGDGVRARGDHGCDRVPASFQRLAQVVRQHAVVRYDEDLGSIHGLAP